MISIDVGDSNIYMLEIKGRAEKLSVLQAKTFPVDLQIITEDNQMDKAVFRKYLDSIFANCKDKEVAVTFSSIPVISNGYRLQYLKNEREMMAAVRAKSAQVMGSNDYTLDYRILKIFSEDKPQSCNVVTYLMPRALIESTSEVISSLGKKPVLLHITQNSIFNFAEAFLQETDMIIVNLTKRRVTLHLINLPENIITRSAGIEEFGRFNVLNLSGTKSQDIIDETVNRISKLLQYQTIKSTGRSIEMIYLMGELADEEAKERIAKGFSEPVKLLREANLHLCAEQEIFEGYIYALAAALK